MNPIKREIDDFIGDEPRFNHALCRRIISEIQEGKCKKRIFVTITKFRFAIVFLLILTFASILTLSIIKKENEIGIGTITDPDTSPVVSVVKPTDNTYFLDFESDAMDRGNHDYYTFFHSKLVVDPNISSLKRGDVIHYKMVDSILEEFPDISEDYLGRVVGLPGETVEIVDGQVYINDKKLDTFYGFAASNGLNEEEYFKQVPPENRVNDEQWREYFSTTMEPIQVEEDTVFVLIDKWWRGFDSKDFGLLKVERIQGKILGYEK